MSLCPHLVYVTHIQDWAHTVRDPFPKQQLVEPRSRTSIPTSGAPQQRKIQAINQRKSDVAAISKNKGFLCQVSSLRGNRLCWWLVLILVWGFDFAPDFYKGSTPWSLSPDLTLPSDCLLLPRSTNLSCFPGALPTSQDSCSHKLTQLVTLAFPLLQPRHPNTPLEAITRSPSPVFVPLAPKKSCCHPTAPMQSVSHKQIRPKGSGPSALEFGLETPLVANPIAGSVSTHPSPSPFSYRAPVNPGPAHAAPSDLGLALDKRSHLHKPFSPWL